MRTRSTTIWIQYFSRLMVLAYLVLGILIASSANSAEITFVTSKQQETLAEGEPYTLCNLRLEGKILPGDAAKFERVLVDAYDRILEDEGKEGYRNWPVVTLCLNSPGGSLNEGIKIAELIRKDRPWSKGSEEFEGPSLPLVPTRLEEGAICNSACALVFMAGTRDLWEADPVRARSMHPLSKLGFHAPALEVSAGQYSETHVNKAFSISISALSSLLRVMNVGADTQGRLYSGSDVWMDGSLLETMLATPFDDMRYIETVDDAGRWDIDVYPLQQPEYDGQSPYQACINEDAWSKSVSSQEAWAHHVSLAEDPLFGARVDPSVGAPKDVVIGMDSYGETNCKLRVGRDGWMEVEVARANENWNGEDAVTQDRFHGKGPSGQLNIGSKALWFHAPETKLASLVPGIADPTASPTFNPAPVAWAPRFGGSKVTLWDHNGSLMAWESTGTQRWIWYYRPKAELLEQAVVPGTLLFEGGLVSGEMSGTARRFSKGCNETQFAVSGRPAGTRVVLQGFYQGPDDQCQSAIAEDATLVFDYLSPEPPN